MAKTVGDFVVERLRAWGVQRVFGYPGDGINGIMAGFEHAGDEGPRFIQARHEEMAAFMAGAHAKFTGEPGVCLATSGPGAIHLLNGLYDAALDHQPVVAIVGQSATTALGGDYQQEVDLQSLFKDVAHNYVTTVTAPASARHAIDRAFRIAISEKCVTCVIFPKDLQEEKAVEQQERAHNTIHSSAGYTAPRIVPRDEDLKRAAEVLNAGQKVAMLVGAGCMRAAGEVVQVADVLGAGFAKALLGKAVLPDETPGCTGSIGLLGTKPSWTMMSECDTLLMVGSSFPYSEFLPKEGQARGVQIDLKGRMLGIRYPMEVNLHGDAAETLRGLLPYLKRKPNRSWRQQLEAGMREWREILEARAAVEAKPLNPAFVYRELNKRLPDRAIVTADSGSTATWYARYLDLKAGMMGSLSGNLATMGPAMPYAVAAKFAYPDRPVLALAGDGAMQMNGNNVLVTVKKYWKEWKDPRFIVLVLNNRDLNMVTWELRAQSGEPKFEGSQEIPDFPYAAYAESLGLMGLRVDRPEDVGRTWDLALAADRPVLVEAVTDPEFPMMPPHITLKEAKAYARSVLKGDPDAKHMIGETIKTAVAGIFKKEEGDDSHPEIGEVLVSAYEIPTESGPESDGTAVWSKTTLVLAELEAGGVRGLGYTYASAAAARLIQDFLVEVVQGLPAFDTRRIHQQARIALRNHGREGVGAMALSAVDIAAWDLKAKLLDVSLAKLLGRVRPEVAAYGSGGFTSYTEAQLAGQLSRWADEGFRFVKMKVGREPSRDLERVGAARKAIGRRCELFVDANGAYSRKQALRFAGAFAEQGVSWFEEPVPKTDVEGLRLIRDRAPMEVTGGEYAWDAHDFRELIPVLDVVQADVTRCGGITGFLEAEALVRAHQLPLSSHCAPAVHVALGCALPAVRHLEWFFDHQRIERILFDGAPQPERGTLRPDLSRPGLGLELKAEDAARYRVHT